MRFNARVWLSDYNNQEGSSGVLLEGVQTLEQLDAFVVGYSAILENMTDALAQRGLAFAKLAPSVVTEASASSSVELWLTVLLASGDNYASFNIPSPKPLVYETQGPFRGYKLDTSIPAQAALLQQLATALAPTLTPSGRSFPVDKVMALLRRPPL